MWHGMSTWAQAVGWKCSDPTQSMLAWQTTCLHFFRCDNKWLKAAATCAVLFLTPDSVKTDLAFSSYSRHPVFFSPLFNFLLRSILFSVYEMFLWLCENFWYNCQVESHIWRNDFRVHQIWVAKFTQDNPTKFHTANSFTTIWGKEWSHVLHNNGSLLLNIDRSSFLCPKWILSPHLQFKPISCCASICRE